MIGVKRARPARVLFATGVTILVVPVVASLSAQVRRKAALNRILGRVQAICREVRPDLESLRFEVTPLKAIRRGEADRDTWSIQISDGQDEYVGATVWDMETGELTSVSWRNDSEHSEEGVRSAEAGDVAKMRLVQMGVPLSSTPIRTINDPLRAGHYWIVWFGICASAAQYRVKVESTNGRLVSVERRAPRSK